MWPTLRRHYAGAFSQEAGSGVDKSGRDADICSHNSDRTTQRSRAWAIITNERGGGRSTAIIATATPIHNTIFDLYNQITLITGGDRSYFSGAGIGDLYRFFLNVRRNVADHETGVALFNLLEEVVIRRTRAFVRKTYPEAMIRGKRINWPERQLKTIRYNLESTYSGIYDRVVEAVEGLHLAPYQLETYKKAGVERDTFEQGREEALAASSGALIWNVSVQRGRLSDQCAPRSGVHQDLRELLAGRQAS